MHTTSWRTTSWRTIIGLALVLGGMPGAATACHKNEDKGEEGDKTKKKKEEHKCKDFDACKKECDDDKAAACVRLGDFHRTDPHGEGGKWDPEAAKKAYDKACKAGNQHGCAEQAAMGAWKTKNAYDLAKKACESDDELGCALAGGMVIGGREFEDGKVEKNVEQGKKDLESQCDKGNLLACNALGDFYQWNGAPDGKKKAADLYKKACDGGQTVGCFSYGAFAEDDKDKSIPWLAKACDAGLAGGIVNRDNSCRVEAERQLAWIQNTSVKLFVEAGQPTPGSPEAAAFRKKLADDAEFQKHDKRMKQIAGWACNMGSDDACKLIVDNANWFADRT